MDQFDPTQRDQRPAAEVSLWRQVRWARVLTLTASMALAGSFWWFIACVLIGA